MCYCDCTYSTAPLAARCKELADDLAKVGQAEKCAEACSGCISDLYSKLQVRCGLRIDPTSAARNDVNGDP